MTALIATELLKVDAFRERAHKLVAVGPEPGSVAERELQHPLARRALTLAQIAWGAAADHLLAWQHLMVRAQVQPIQAHATLSRAAIENAVLTRWLMEPDIGAEERLRRGVGAQLEDYRQRRAFEAAAGREPTRTSGPGQPAAVRRTDFQAEAQRHGVTPEDPPLSVVLCREYGVGTDSGVRGLEWLYRLLSAYAHGHEWAMAAHVVEAAGPAPGMSETSVAVVTGSDQIAAVAAKWSVATLERALVELEVYHVGVPDKGDASQGAGSAS